MAKIEVRVEGILVNHSGALMLALHEKKGKAYWVLPGGHVDHLEKMESALKRELLEELGAQQVRVKELAFLDEYINPEIPRHIIKAGFRIEMTEKEIHALKVITEDEAIKDIRFFLPMEIEASKDIFYPSKDFYLNLLESIHG